MSESEEDSTPPYIRSTTSSKKSRSKKNRERSLSLESSDSDRYGRSRTGIVIGKRGRGAGERLEDRHAVTPQQSSSAKSRHKPRRKLEESTRPSSIKTSVTRDQEVARLLEQNARLRLELSTEKREREAAEKRVERAQQSLTEFYRNHDSQITRYKSQIDTLKSELKKVSRKARKVSENSYQVEAVLAENRYLRDEVDRQQDYCQERDQNLQDLNCKVHELEEYMSRCRKCWGVLSCKRCFDEARASQRTGKRGRSVKRGRSQGRPVRARSKTGLRVPSRPRSKSAPRRSSKSVSRRSKSRARELRSKSRARSKSRPRGRSKSKPRSSRRSSRSERSERRRDRSERRGDRDDRRGDRDDRPSGKPGKGLAFASRKGRPNPI